MIPAPYQLRPATEQDLPEIVRIYNSIIPGRMVTADLEPVSVEQRRPWLQAHANTSRPAWVLVDTTSEQTVGWMSFDTFYPRAAYDGTVMIAIYLDEAQRKRGLGRMLLAHALELAPGMGIHTILGYIFGHNTPSLSLFASMGFERWAHLPRVAILDGTERDLIIMGKRCSA